MVRSGSGIEAKRQSLEHEMYALRASNVPWNTTRADRRHLAKIGSRNLHITDQPTCPFWSPFSPQFTVSLQASCACPLPGIVRQGCNSHNLNCGVSASTTGNRSSDVSSSQPFSISITDGFSSLNLPQPSVGHDAPLYEAAQGAEFALLAGARCTDRAADGLYPFESKLLGHFCIVRQAEETN
jgi:hypothetical protein